MHEVETGDEFAKKRMCGDIAVGSGRKSFRTTTVLPRHNGFQKNNNLSVIDGRLLLPVYEILSQGIETCFLMYTEFSNKRVR